MEEFFDLFEPQGTAEGCGHREAVRYSPVGSSYQLVNTFFMDRLDPFRPRFSPVVNSIPYRYSVGAYRGKKRVVIAWFSDESSAIDYLRRCRSDCPFVKYDCLQSLL